MTKWFAIVNSAHEIVGNAVTDGDNPAGLPDGIFAIESDFVAPNPEHHQIVEMDGVLSVAIREPTIDDERAAAHDRIDRTAALIRSAYITTTPGQDIVYAQKEAEAMAALEQIAAGQQPNDADYPFLAAEMDVTGKTLAEVAQQIIAVAQQWKAIGAQIERARRAGKLAADAATDKTGVQQALDAAISELNGLLPGNTE